MGLASRKRLRKCSRKGDVVNGKDPFSQLPDEVIVSHILSRFTLEEGARYCLISHRWKNLWARTIGPKLIFAPEHLRAPCVRNSMGDRVGVSQLRPCSKESIEGSIDAKVNQARPSFECWITNVLQAYRGTKLDELTVRFPFYFASSDSIDTWVECALRKGVTRLELDFSYWGRIFDVKTYNFPRIGKLLGKSTLAPGLCNLTDVCLKDVNVASEDIEFMLANCPLERLCLWNSFVKEVRNCGELVRLKSLELINCHIDIKISASSLVSLKYDGPESSLHLEHVPQLSVLSVGTKFCTTFLRRGLQHFSYITRLKSLELVMSVEAVRESINYPLVFPEALKLEELKVILNGKKNPCLLWPILLIKASPFLRKFFVKMSLLVSGSEPQLHEGYLTSIRNAAKIVHRHQYLKLVEFHDFVGVPCELELIQHLLSISDSLEQFVVAPYPLHQNSGKLVQRVRKEAEKLACLIPLHSRANLIVL